MKKASKHILAILLAILLTLSAGMAAGAAEILEFPEESEQTEEAYVPEAPEIIEEPAIAEDDVTLEAQGVALTITGFPAWIFFEGSLLGRFIVQYVHLGTPFGLSCVWTWLTLCDLLEPFLFEPVYDTDGNMSFEGEALRAITLPLAVVLYPLGLALFLNNLNKR